MSRNSLITAIFTVALLAAPALAQHGDMGGAGGHPGHGMGEMPGGPMMEHMNQMMDHMSQMMQEMQALHEQSAATMPGHGEGAGSGHMAGTMQHLTGEIESMMPHMEAMLQSLRDYMAGDDPAMQEHAEQMQEVMKNMEGMMQAGVNVMSTMHTMQGTGPASPPAAGHEEHKK